jgi:hypothetical protein
VQLVVQPLQGTLCSAMRRGGAGLRRQRVRRLVGYATALALASQIGQRGAVTVVGLEPPRPQLCLGGGGLRRRKLPHRSGKAWLSSRLQAWCSPPVASMANTGAAGPAWSTTSRPTGTQPDPIGDLPRIDRTTNVDADSASCSKPTTTSRPPRRRRQDAPAGTRSTAISYTPSSGCAPDTNAAPISTSAYSGLPAP